MPSQSIETNPSWTIEVWACPWVLTSQHFGVHKCCGYISNGPGVCPYDHPQEVKLVNIVTLKPDWGAVARAEATETIVEAAVDLRNVIRAAVGPVGRDDAEVVQAVIDAVNEAGL